MVIEGEWQARFIQLYAPELKWSAGFVPNPASMPELDGTAFLSASMFFIPTNSSHPEEAFTFMQHLLSEEAMRDFTLALANLPTRTSLLEDPAYADIPGMNYWLDSLKSDNLVFNPSTSWEEEYRTEIASTTEEVINLRKSPEDALNELQEKALKLADS
jgi:multiple sugar transport system substrate-binding protein